jgi:hypothetical protein
MASVFLKAVALWGLLLLLALANGFTREALLAPRLGAAWSQPLSGLALALMIFVVTLVLLPWLGLLRPQQYWHIGLLWLILTVSFEFLFGLLVLGRDPAALLAAYDITTGNLWLLVLAAILVSPAAAARLRGIV